MNPRKKFKPRNSSSNLENELPNLFRPIVPHSEHHFYLKNSPNSKHFNHPKQPKSPNNGPAKQQLSPKQSSPNNGTKQQQQQPSPNKQSKNRSPKQSPQEYRKAVQRKAVLVDNASPVKRQLNYTDRKSPVQTNKPTQQAKRLKCPAKTPDQLLSTSPSFADFASPKSFMSPNAAEVPLPPTTWISTNTCAKQMMDSSNISAQLKELLNVA